MDMPIPTITSLIPCNAAAPPVAELCNHLLYEVDEASSLSAERLCLEAVVEEIVEEGRIGVIGGIPSSLLLESDLLLVRRGGGPIGAGECCVCNGAIGLL